MTGVGISIVVAYGVVVETSAYDLTVFKVHYGRLNLKIYTKRERVLRIEVMVRNTKELSCGRSPANFSAVVAILRGMPPRKDSLLPTSPEK